MREMKDSGIPWIGEIPKDWNVKKLKFSCKLFGRIGFRGYTADDLVEESEGAITLSPTNMNNFNLDYSKCSYLSWDKYYESPEIMVEVGDVLLVKTASVGKCSYVDYLPKETTVNPQILVLKEHKDCSKFVTYLFHTSIGEAYIDTTKGGSTIYTISQEKIGNYEFAFPPFTEQQKIASFLDRKCADVDEMIALQEQTIGELKAYKQSVITEAVTKGLNPDVPMKDSGIEWIGQIPEHWEVRRIKYLLNERKERSVDGSEEPLSMSQKYGLIPTKEMDVIPNMASTFEGAKIVYTNDLVFNKLKAHLGVFATSEYNGLVSPDYAVYYGVGRALMPFMEYMFKTPQYISEFRKTATGVGSGLTRLYTSDLFAMLFPLPSIQEQEEIVSHIKKKCGEIDELIAIKQSKIDSLKEYKKSIIYEYVTGKREVE